MRPILLNVLIALGLGCAHTPKQWKPSLNELYVARGIQYAIRVIGPAPAYDVHPPAGLISSRVLDLAAEYSGLVRESPGVLRSPNADGHGGRTIRITVESPEWMTPAEALVRFRFSRSTTDETSCEVRLRRDDAGEKAWQFMPRGEEQCWPRPSA